MNRSTRAVILVLLLACAGCDRPAETGAPPEAATLSSVAERYVKIALAFRRYDADYVDAYFGPEEWARESQLDPPSLAQLRAETSRLADLLTAASGTEEEIVRHRRSVLLKRLTSMRLRMDMTEGRLLEFDAESAALFDAVAPDHDAAYFDPIIRRIDALVPGKGPLRERLETFRARFEIPKERLEAVFQAAIAECRKRTLEHIDLPADERFTIEYVTDQPWSGYNWYKGDHYSLIQINTDLPIYISRAVDLGCHEGYPGHHTYNVLIEDELVAGRGWVEFTLNPLYGPQSLISEGSANFGIDMAFPGDERGRFEKEVLFPLAGLDPAEADRYYDVLEATADLDYAGNEAARDYLNGSLTPEQAVDWLVEHTLMPRARAEQRVRFFDTYRSYVINYNLGQDLVEAFITRLADDDVDRRWAEFERLLSEPITPADLK